MGGNTQKVIGAHKAGDWSFDNGAVTVGGIDLVEGEFEFRLVSDAEGAAATLPGKGGIVVLDTVVTPELEREGVARDLIRRIQTARREAELDVSDRISLTLRFPKWLQMPLLLIKRWLKMKRLQSKARRRL